MRLYEVNERIQNLVNEINKYCIPFLNEWHGKNKYFIKGIKSQGQGLIENPDYEGIKRFDTRGSKRPKMFTSPLFTETLSKLMSKNGFEATRLNGNFVFPNHLDFEIPFGTTYVIIPHGNFSLTWQNPRVIDDMGGNKAEMVLIRLFNNDKNMHDFNYNSMDKNRFEQWKEELNDLPDILEYNLNEKSVDREQMAHAFWDIFGHNFHHGQDVDAALNSNAEVIIKSPGYYALTKELFEHIQPFLL